MLYKKGQEITQADRANGKEFTYQFLKMPAYMEPRRRQVAGACTQPALCNNLQMNVMVRGPQYTLQERSAGVDGLVRGRQRFERQVRLLNQVQRYTSACPEPLDLIYVHNRDDFPADQEALARREPRLISEHLEGESLDQFGFRKSHYKALKDNGYWFEKAVKHVDDHNRFKGLSVKRVAQLLARLATHCQALLSAGVAHLDLKPEHILILKLDEVPRLLGLGHLAPLNQRGQVEPSDPVHAFTTAGFVAPELISEGWWDQPQDGEAIMLYSLGAVVLSMLFVGPRADLSALWRSRGREAIDELIQEMLSSKSSKAHMTLYRVIAKLLEPNPAKRKAQLSMEQLIEEMTQLRYGPPKEEMTCKRCDVVFKGDPERSHFNYNKKRFPLCPQHHSEAMSDITYVAPRCGHSVKERAGLVWAREWMGWHPRARCFDCQE